MVPTFVRTSTWGSAASAPVEVAAAESTTSGFQRYANFISTPVLNGVLGRAFIENLPLPGFLHPVLALAHDIGEIIGAVVLIEGHHHEFAFARIAEHGDARQLYLDPAFSGIHRALVHAPCGEILAAGAEAPGVVREVSASIAAFPVCTPLLECGGERATLRLDGSGIAPLDFVGDDYRREPHLHVGADGLQVRIGEHDAAVARTRRAAVDGRGRAVQ